MACCGFELTRNPVLDFGSIRAHSAKALIDKANDNLLVKAISLFGPGFLVKFARLLKPGIIPEKEYVGICEACQDVVTNKDVLDLLFRNRVRLAALIEHTDKTIGAAVETQQKQLENA